MEQGFESKAMHLQAIAMVWFVWLSLSLNAALAATSADTAVGWAVANYPQITDKVLGSPGDVNTSAPAASRWVIVTRVRPAFDNPEYEVVVTETKDGLYTARVCEARETSIFQQIVTLREQHADWNEMRIASGVKVGCRDIDAKKHQRRLAELAREFTRIQVAVRLPNVITTDPTSYHLWSLSGSQWIEMNVLGQEGARDTVIRWVETLRRETKSMN